MKFQVYVDDLTQYPMAWALASRKRNLVKQEIASTHCHEVLMKQAKKVLIYPKTASYRVIFLPKARRKFPTDKVSILVGNPRALSERRQRQILRLLNQIEMGINLTPTGMWAVTPRILYFEGDPRWLSNSLTFSTWISLIRGIIQIPYRKKTWKELLCSRTYFRHLGYAGKFDQYIALLPKLMASKLPTWDMNSVTFMSSYIGIGTYLTPTPPIQPNTLTIFLQQNLWNVNLPTT